AKALSEEADGTATRAWHPRQRLWRPIALAVITISLVLSAWNWRSIPTEANRELPRLSIVVLPFDDLSEERDQEHFADGITEDLTTDLSRIAGSFVISGNTAVSYKNKAVDAKLIGRELGVRYIVRGSVRRSDNQVRVNAQLINAETSAHLFAERF